MGLRFQRRIRVLPGVHLNLSRSGVGVSIGGSGAHVGITARGQRYSSVGLQCTGVSWREYGQRPPNQCELCQHPGHVHIPAAVVIGMIVLGTILLLAAFGRI
jgi:Protein of unknown function (DUF4236)